jgi:hypothetical protein
MAVGGDLDFSSFDGVARSHPRSSGPRGWSPRFLASSQAPTLPNCFGRRRIWWPRHLLRVLGFGSVRGKIRAPWPPIYRDLGHISKRILLRSRFAPSIELFSALVWINPMGKNLGWLRAWDELGRGRRLALGQLGRGCFTRGRAGWLQLGRAGLRRSEGEGVAAGPGSASGRVSAHSQFCYLKFLFSKSIYNLQTNLNSFQI